MPIRIGDLRPELAIETQKKVVGILDDNKHRYSYYLLMHTNYDRIASAKYGAKAIRTTFMILDEEPPKMLGSHCFFINNRFGKPITELWALPLDIPTEPGTIKQDSSKPDAPEVFESARGMRIIH